MDKQFKNEFNMDQNTCYDVPKKDFKIGNTHHHSSSHIQVRTCIFALAVAVAVLALGLVAAIIGFALEIASLKSMAHSKNGV